MRSAAWAALVLLAFALARAEPGPVVVELFTSQSCYSCPPAEAFLGQLAKQPGIVALEWHVSYWNELVYGKAGRWADPFSSPVYTERQRAYSRGLQNSGNVYTPQMVVGGRYETVGSDRSEVEKRIARNRKDASPVVAAIVPDESAGLRAKIEGRPTDATIWLVTYMERRTTEVRGGENQGKTLNNHHIVTGLTSLGQHDAQVVSHAFAAPKPGEGCALLIQENGVGAILGAATCPTPDAVRR